MDWWNELKRIITKEKRFTVKYIRDGKHSDRYRTLSDVLDWMKRIEKTTTTKKG